MTDDIGEALAISDRILVMADGRITASLAGDRATEHEVAALVAKDAA